MSWYDTLGNCSSCGDTEGPWTLYKGRWLCDSCIARIKRNEKSNPEGAAEHEKR